MLSVEQPHSDHEHRQQIDQRAGHPHDHARGRLVSQGRQPPDVRNPLIVRIQHPVGERQQGRQGGVLHVGQDQIREQEPSRPARAAGIGPDHGIPEQEPRAEEAEVLDRVPAGRTQCGFVDWRGMPEPGGGDEDRQRHDRMREPTEQPAKPSRAQHRGDPVGSHGRRQAAEDREQRRAQPDERRRDHHEQQVLDHVGLEHQRGERFDRRGQGEEERPHASQEARELAAMPGPRVATMESPPAAKVDQRR